VAEPTHDIVILGAGPAGMAFAALAVADAPDRRVLLIDQSALADKAREKRVLALSEGSRQILARAGLWDVALPRCAIAQVHVSQQGRLGRTMVTAAELGSPALGYSVEYGELLQTMAARLPDSIEVLRPASASPHGTVIGPQGVLQHLKVQHGEQSTVMLSQLLVRAEGGLFAEHDTSAFDASHDYHQHALLVRVRIIGLPAAQAWERFTDQGPIALVPLAPEHFSLVWCASPEESARRLALPPAALAVDLAAAYGERFTASAIQFESAPKVYPLGLNWRDDTATGGIVTLGNAAQTLHPVAAQGLNLALRDAAELVDALAAPATEWPQQTRQWAANRQTDRHTTRGLTHAMAQFFATRFAPVQHALGLGLLALDTVPPARRWVGRQLMLGARRATPATGRLV
jgi:2-octaprenyl-6-methoxyphenol hydroxylase